VSEWRHSVLYNVISGAVKNTLDGHPNWIVPRHFARSIAKRAAGTLAGMNPGVALAAARQSGQRKRLRMMTASVNGLYQPILKGAAHVPMDARLLKFCQYAIEKRIADAKKSGDHARYISLCTAARIVKQELKLMEAQGE
jgi:hypothetical protein